MPSCIRCHTNKDTSDFRKDANRPTGHQSICRQCAKVEDKLRYRNTYRDAVKTRTKLRNKTSTERINEYKVQRGCARCAEKEPSCLEFHHLNDDKEFTVAAGRNKSWSTVVLEIEKCMVLCSNCHRKHHAGVIDLVPSSTG